MRAGSSARVHVHYSFSGSFEMAVNPSRKVERVTNRADKYRICALHGIWYNLVDFT